MSSREQKIRKGKERSMAQRVMVGMSGGVDSSVAALLLQRQGWQVTGVTLRLRGGRLREQRGEDAEKDIQDAARVCAALGIAHQVLDLSEDFRRHVVDAFAQEYLAGRTPNPCVVCNRTVKFGGMLDYALEQGMDCVATGHYAHAAYDPETGRWKLYRGGSAKDQSYVLYGLSQQQLAHIRFPLWGMEKEQVRALAREAGLPVADKGDSMEICFVPKGGHAAFLEWYTGAPMKPGDFVDETGKVLGRHQGIGRYTIGQRKGLGVAFGRPRYVVRIDAARNEVVLGEEGRQTASSLLADDLRYLSIAPPCGPIRITARIRYQAPDAPALLTPLADGTARVDFDAPQRSITPGQAVVFYDGDLVLGGGTIRQSL